MKLFNTRPSNHFLHVILLIGGLVPYAPAAEPSGDTVPGNFSGKVIETLESAGYTYVRVDTGGAQHWAAAPQFVVEVGDTVSVGNAVPMRNYHSKTLDRDFEVVYFTGDARVHGESPAASGNLSALPKGHPPVTGHGSPAQPAPLFDFSDINKADGGKRISEIYRDKARLNGKEVAVRGRVVKMNANIMGRNWIHIQDGTGEKGGNDLTVTSTNRAKAGDVVLVTGKVTTDRDFGGSYQYSIIIEDAKITVE